MLPEDFTLTDLHVHSCFSDGKHTPEEIAEQAFSMGMHTLGLSDHACTAFDPEPAMKPDHIEEYKETVLALKEKYQGKMNILLGIEQDIDADFPAEGYDYMIGSVHYLSDGHELLAIDHSAAQQRELIDTVYGGDPLAFAEAYFKRVSEIPDHMNADIIGHFDLITKYQEQAHIFDQESDRYRKAWMNAADRLLKKNVVFEINTGGISRKHRTTPFPSFEIIDYLRDHGGRLILSSDSHNKMTLMYEFDKWRYLLK